MAIEILGHTVGATVNEVALHSMAIMEKFANGEAYNEAIWIERGRHAVHQTLEGMFEVGRALIVIKEHTPHGRFAEITEKEFGISIPDDQAEKITTVGDAIAHIENSTK